MMQSARFGCPPRLGANAAWEARAAASMLDCTNHFVGEGAALDNADASSSSGSGSGGYGQVLDSADASSKVVLTSSR
jgi:hypothetical protein